MGQSDEPAAEGRLDDFKSCQPSHMASGPSPMVQDPGNRLSHSFTQYSSSLHIIS